MKAFLVASLLLSSTFAFAAPAVPCDMIKQMEPSISDALKVYVKNGLNPDAASLLDMVCKLVQDTKGTSCKISTKSVVLCDFYTDLKK